jgi:hypothetical protein
MKIAEYLAPNERLTPSNEGFSAFETAGRRIGPLYNQQAQDIKEEGRLKAQEIEDLSRWPFDILNLRNDVAQAQADKLSKVGVRIGSVREGYDAFSDTGMDSYGSMRQISRGAPVMAATARQLISPQSFNQPGATTFDPNAVTTGPSYTLQNGQFVKVNNQDPNAAYAKENNQLADNINVQAANDWYAQNSYGGTSPGSYGGGPNATDPNLAQNYGGPNDTTGAALSGDNSTYPSNTSSPGVLSSVVNWATGGTQGPPPDATATPIVNPNDIPGAQ